MKHPFAIQSRSLWGHLLLCAFFLLACNAFAQNTTLLPIAGTWRYQQTQDLDGSNWMSTAFNDSLWPSGTALFYSETNAAVAPRNTPLNLGRITYYFRSGFNFTGPTNHFLVFSNKLDDGAVFYLNGQEIQRVRMADFPTAITYTNRATDTPPGGDATGWDVFSIPATSLLVGTNVVAVEVHQQSSSSSDVVFGCSLTLRPLVVRGPYLQIGTSSNVVIRWRTGIATDSRVSYGTNSANLSSSVDDSAMGVDHELTVENLSAGTKYFYAVGGSAGVLEGGDTNFSFFTAPLPGSLKPTRIWVLGDAGTADANQAAVRDAYYNHTTGRETDLILMLGDNAYDNGTDKEHQAAVFDMYKDILRRTVLWSTLGNHETAQSTSNHNNYPYFQILTLPTNGAAGGMASGTEHYYSFDYANIHFVCLDSMTMSRATNGAMANWLRADLASNTNDWLIAFWHHPPYTKGSHNSDTETPLVEMRVNFLPILEGAGVDLVLSGHSHSYERSYLIDGHYSASTNFLPGMILNSGSGREGDPKGAYTKWASESQGHQGAVYAVAGSSGRISGGSLNHPAMFVSLNQLGSMVLDVSGDRLDAKFINSTNGITDSFSIFKRDVRFVAMDLEQDYFRLAATNVASGKTNLLQVSTTLTGWNTIGTNVSSSNRLEFLIPRSNNVPAEFFRILRLP